MLQAAMQLRREYRFSVIPVGLNKIPLIPWKEYISRLPTEEEIRGWFRDLPVQALGVVTGLVSDLLVIDIDQPEALEIIERYLPDTLLVPWVNTPRGQHLYFRSVPGVGNRTGLIPGVDVRSTGGYIVIPPSPGYSWEVSLENEVPEVPSALERLLRSGQTVPTVPKEDDVPSVPSHSGPQEGRRDNALFHIAMTMFRGGASEIEVSEAVLAMAASCNPPFPRDQALIKVRSALERVGAARAADIREWVSATDGYFTIRDVAEDLGVRDRGNIRKVLFRLKDRGEIEPYGSRAGTYRKAAVGPEFKSLSGVAEIDEVPLRWPLQVEDLVRVSPGSVIVLAGETNAGKTGYAINFCDLNMDRHKITYFSTETSDVRFVARTKSLDRPKADWDKVRFTDGVLTDFHLHLDPEGINVIDYLEPDVEALWRIASSIQKIFGALTIGVALICIQKKKGCDLGYGGAFTAFKSELYMAMSQGERGSGELKIIKAKTWRSPGNNPNFQKRSFYINHGVIFTPNASRPEWFSGNGDKPTDY